MNLYSLVKLNSERFTSQGIERGREGTVIEDYGNRTYEVDFSKDYNEIITLIVREDDIECINDT